LLDGALHSRQEKSATWELQLPAAAKSNHTGAINDEQSL